MTNADALLQVNAKGEVIKTPTQAVQIADESGHAAKVTVGGKLQVETTLIAGEITIGNVKVEGSTGNVANVTAAHELLTLAKVEGSAGNVANVNTRHQLQQNTENVVETKTVNKIENVEVEVPGGYEQATIWLRGVYTGLSITVKAKRGTTSVEFPLVINTSTGTSGIGAKIITNGSTNNAFSGNIPSGAEKILIEVTAISTGEVTVDVVFGNEPWQPQATTNVIGTQAQGAEPTSLPIVIAGEDPGKLLHRFRHDAYGAAFGIPFNPEKIWREKLSVAAGASAKESKTVAGEAGWIYVITQIFLRIKNAATVTEYPEISLTVKEETSESILAEYKISTSQLTKGNDNTLALAANPLNVASVEGKGLIVEIAKGTVAEGEGSVYLAGYKYRNK